MADTMEEAAKAFDADIKSERAPATKAPNAPRDITEGPPERMFENVGELEVDEDSPIKGGGDTEEELDDEGDEDSKDGEEDEEEPEEEEEESDADKEFLALEVPVTVDGKEQKVTIKEALEGYVRTTTFHQRMNEVEEAKKIIQRTANDAIQNYEYSTSIAKEIHAYLEALVPPAPNWDEEFRKDPARAREVQKYYEQVEGFKKNMQAKLDEANMKRQESHAVQLGAYIEAEARRFDQVNNKSWAADPKKKVKDLQAMRRTALSQGFSEEELSQTYDSRMLQILLKASKFDRMMASRPKPVRQQQETKQVASTAAPARRRQSNSGINNAMKQLNRSGRLDDAAVVFDHIIRREG